ncbi:hypothetical protein ACFQZZ_16535 [Nocardia sp. GCM10030253]|uniref:lipase/acyltransferase domain-containing protein n=1 Tax=Nocardia sp. GCM10030253 TaxID=3273404 RepID=UPI0036332F65
MQRSITHDAIVVLPGIMGSELVDAATGTTLWGLADAGWYLRAWSSPSGLDVLRVSDDERSGRVGRIQPGRLLRFPAFAPLLRGFEPYTALIEGLRQVVADPAAILAFPYDWRLPVTHNAGLLADAAERHLTAWRSHRSGSRSAKLVLVAHSMGGLVARYFTGVLGGDSEVRTTIAFGTPFRGSVKAARILAEGKGTPMPLPNERLRSLVSTMPGVHDLLPSYRCVTDGASARRLTPLDVAQLGGDSELAESSASLHERISRVGDSRLRVVVGVEQSTPQSMRLDGGELVVQQWAYLPDPDTGVIRSVDRRGDGTVYRDAASGGVEPLYLSQTHGAMASTAEAISYARAVVTERALGAWLGTPPLIGLVVPDLATAGVAFEIMATAVADPAAVTCVVSRALDNSVVAAPVLIPDDNGGLSASVTLTEPDLYRVALQGQAFSAVTELMMVTAPDR